MRLATIKASVMAILPSAMLTDDGEYYYVESATVTYGGGLSPLEAWAYTLELLSAV